MHHGEPAPRPATRRQTSRRIPSRRTRRPVFLLLAAGVACLVLLVAVSAFVARLGRSQGMTSPGSSRGTASFQMSEDGWPAQGEAAMALGSARLSASPDQRVVPTASLAKVMTAYLTLERYPLSATAPDGFTVTVTPLEAEEEARDADQGQSVVPVRPGEQLTERQLLEALLIPSGDNIARILAARVGGTEAAFLASMNAEARTLGMDHTTYTDPSGFDSGSVSTAADQLRVFRRALRLQVFREIVSMPSVTLPVAGTVANFDPLIAQGYIGKTGSDSAAGGCLAFATEVTVNGIHRQLIGVVMGQGRGSDTIALLRAAGRAAEGLVGSVSS